MDESSGSYELEGALEDYLTRIDNGEMPDREEYYRRYPGCAMQLAEFFRESDSVDRRIDEVKSVAQTVGLGRVFACAAQAPTTGQRADDPDPSLPSFRGFRILAELGRGSQGIVYKAEQLGTRRTVALKVIRDGMLASATTRRRFENEVELASRLEHPNIVAVHHCGQDTGRDYFAMEYVEGDPLDVYIATHALDRRMVVELFLQLCEAVSYAHRRGVIHRDLKPSNALVDGRGRIRVLDFGLAKAIRNETDRERSTITQVGEFAGTWYYASPEQVRGDHAVIDVRSDVYALGVIFYEILTGRLPYAIEDEPREVIVHHVLEADPIRLSRVIRDIDDDLQTIVLRALRKEPERRYQSAGALAEDILRYLAGDAIEAKRDHAWYILRKALRRYRWQLIALGAAFATLTAFALTIWILYGQALSAQATTAVRAAVVRNSERYTLEKLDELNWSSNRLHELAVAHPDLPEVRALGRELFLDPVALLASATQGMPPNIEDTLRSADNPGYIAAVEWLRAHEKELDEIETLTETRRFVFGVRPSSESDHATADLPVGLDFALTGARALIGRALHRDQTRDFAQAAHALEAARSLAVDVADGRLLHHKVVSTGIRSRIYDAVLFLLARRFADPSARAAYTGFVQRDPPLSRYRPAMLAARAKVASFVEDSSFGTTPRERGYLDLDVLNEQAGRVFERTSALTPENRSLTHATVPHELLAVVDAYMHEAESWDALTYEQLLDAADAVRTELRNHKGFSLAILLLEGKTRALNNRGRVRSQRAATLLAARICDYYSIHGSWPSALADAARGHAGVSTTDPYTGRSFGYRIVEGTPRIYSLNEDGLDHGGRHGPWGEDGTDVVFFVRPAP